ncbi:MAG: alanine--glyoxylate aminotransferase family protein [candidate division WOR-3 bacterium]|nr:alanine--glyoxylate aminotransferase family protein [candidate division WOR-3 bacterium]
MKKRFNKKYTLFTPGPTEVLDFILEELSRPLVYHREASFATLFEDTTHELKKIFLTKGRVFVFTSSGTGAMEAAVCNLISRNDKVLVVSCGKFGERWRELLIRYGAYVRTLTAPYGATVLPEDLERRLRTDDSIKFVFTTLTETSTGALSDIKSYGEICHKLNRLLIVDAIAGLGADEFKMDEYKVAVAVGASQKALACPPGLSFLACNEDAWTIIKASHSPRYYFDLLLYERFREQNQTPWTPAISLFYGLYKTLKQINQKGIKHFWNNHKIIAEYCRKEIQKMGLEIFPTNPSNGLTVIKLPENVDGTKIVDYIKKKHKLLFSNGQAELRGKIIRIGHMGYIKKTMVTNALKAFRDGYHKIVKS